MIDFERVERLKTYVIGLMDGKKGKKLLIQYFALRDTSGKYQGTLEVSQDITEIQKIEGQKRLLEWDSNK